MKVAVYDRYWPTGGGGEKFAAGIAAALADDHDVWLVAHEPVDTGWLGERLQLDLSRLRVDVQSEDAGAVSRASASYDLFVNASFRSGDPNRAGRGLYVVHFPGPVPSRTERLQTALAGRSSWLQDGRAEIAFGDGFYLPDRVRMHTIHWTAGVATLTVTAWAPVDRVPVSVLIGRFVPPQVAPVEVTAEVGGAVVGRATVTAPRCRADRRRTVRLRFDVTLDGRDAEEVVLRCQPWVPAENGVGGDTRRLGVPVIGVQAGGGWRRAAAGATPWLLGGRNHLDFLDSYDRVLANSAYTRRWVRRLWGRDSDVFHPPVTSMPRGDKQPIILSVGRFFVPGAGHNKKQLELVQAFRQLCAGGVTGWELHLAGGCAPSDTAYVDRLREAAAGLPVVLHLDASGAELRDLYGRAAVYWHAAGLDEDVERYPDRHEHFGITTVEAMSAGAVPVVIDAAGQVEIVEHGVSGYRFGSLAGLVRHTEHLIADPSWRERLSAAAERRAGSFGWDAFVERTRALVVSE